VAPQHSYAHATHASTARRLPAHPGRCPVRQSLLKAGPQPARGLAAPPAWGLAVVRCPAGGHDHRLPRHCSACCWPVTA